MPQDRKLKIAIDCRISTGKQGIGTAVIALAKGLSDSDIQSQEYTFIVMEPLREWLAPFIHGPCKLVGIANPVGSALDKVKASLRGIAPLRYLFNRLRDGAGYVPRSDGYAESNGFDLIHFPTQQAFLTSLPSIYQPWDLQHRHYPEFFSRDEFSVRDRLYQAFCEQATFVCVQAEWTRQDVIHQFSIPEEKIVVIPWGSVLGAYEQPSPAVIEAAVRSLHLPEVFFFYPAAAWPHKNHAVILRALAHLKTQHGLIVHVYFTGSSPQHLAIDQLAAELGVTAQIHFLGFISTDELQAVFSAATAMLFPSKFEGFGLPILEAFHARLPIIASNATTLPEIGQEAALYFDPNAPDQLAEHMLTLMRHPEVRQQMIAKGVEVLSRFRMQTTVESFQRLYERTAATTRIPTVSQETI